MKTFDDEITLISKKLIGRDDYGNPNYELVKKELLCNIESIGRQEFYQASSQNLKIQAIVSIHKFEYSNEDKVILDGKELDVIKTYVVDDLIELTVGEKIG